MQKITYFLQRHATKFKLLFLVFICCSIILALKDFAAKISLTQLTEIFQQLDPLVLVLMSGCGLIAIIPMLGYDWLLNRSLQSKKKLSYLLETSWLINTVNNLIGFGGLVSAGLRLQCYGTKTNQKTLIQQITTILFFTLSGLSLYSLLSCGVLLVHPTLPQTNWLWLIGGSCYFPLIFLVHQLKQKRFSFLTKKQLFSLVSCSFLEWTGVLVNFLAVGYLMGINVTFFKVIPLFIASTVIGIASMIPGELFSFDLMMIAGLTTLGVTPPVATVWLLLFRISYYLIPFLLGGVFFLKNFRTIFKLSSKQQT